MAKTPQGAEPGPGELAERAKRRRMIRTVASLMVAGGVTGFTLALTETGPEGPQRDDHADDRDHADACLPGRLRAGRVLHAA